MSIATNRLKLLAILALFLLPLLAAVLMFNGQLPRLSGETVNQGKLVQPPVVLDWSKAESTPGSNPITALQGSWVILFPLPPDCEQECLQKVTGLRQTHRATGREQQRIAMVLLTTSPLDEDSRQQFTRIYDQFILLSDTTASLQQSIQSANLQSNLSESTLNSYLVDPLGNIMMAYDSADSEMRLSKDLKRLLKWSKQDKE
jgi:peroxiredoxin